MEPLQDKIFTPVKCHQCNCSEGVVKVERYEEEWADQTTVEEYLLCPECGSIMDYDIEFF